MKPLHQLATVCILSASLCGHLSAQQLKFNDFELIEGSDLQQGASYRFHDVTAGVDAVIKVKSLSNATLNSIDDSPISTNSLDDAAWRPVINGVGTTGEYELHYVDFDIQFYASSNNSPVLLDNLTMSIFDTDGDNDRANFSDGGDGNILEFAQVAGFANLISAGSNLNTQYYEGGSALVSAKDSTTNPGVTDAAQWLSVWEIENRQGFSVRFGWQGTDNVQSSDNDRLYGAYFNGETTPVIIVPEPSSAFMCIFATLPMLLRRKR